MARYKRGYSGEKRTEPVKMHLTPSELAALEKGAARKQVSLSNHARELCVRRSAAAIVVAGASRDPEIKALADEMTAWGRNLNQLAKLCNTDKSAPQRAELATVTEQLKAALGHVLALR